MRNKVITMLETLVQRNSLADQRVSQDELIRDDSNSFIPTSYVILICVIYLLLCCTTSKYIVY